MKYINAFASGFETKSNLPQNSSISLLSAPQLFLEKIFILDNYF